MRGAICSKVSDTLRLIPLMSDAITMTTITPMATPRIVRAARPLFARSEPSAMPTPSNNAVVSYSCRRAAMGSSRAARVAG